jgi:uncharacterized protein (TIGR01777 family)
MRVVMSGASGLIGAALASSLTADGHDVVRLVRRAPRGPDEVQWHPDAGELDPDALRGADVVVCLSGANVGEKRWTDSYKRTLRSSRLDTTSTIARTIAGLGDDAPPVFVAGNAIGYYGDTGDAIADESTPPGDGFLARLCVEWEQAAQPAVDAGTRVVTLRTGPVLDKDADLVKRLRPIVKLGVAGPIGNGRQFLPWIALSDEIRAIRFLIDSDVSGPVNLCAPNPARNKEFTRTMARILHRSAVLPVPGFAVRVVAGELGGETVKSQRAIPAKLTEAGFVFDYPELEPALRAALA